MTKKILSLILALAMVLPLVPAFELPVFAEEAHTHEEEVAAPVLTDTNPSGGFVEPRTFKDYYNQILELAGLRHFTFHALRHTFASRAMEQGMDAKTLSMILGHYSVSFTLDTYTHVLDEHKHQGIALMDELYGGADPVKETLYPVVVTMQTDGFLQFQIPGIPKVSCCHSDLPSGLEHIRESLSEEMLLSPVPLTPAPPPSLTQNQTVVYIKA